MLKSIPAARGMANLLVAIVSVVAPSSRVFAETNFDPERVDDGIEAAHSTNDVVVLIAVEFDEETHAVPGIVFSQVGEQALIATRIVPKLRKRAARPALAQPTYSVCLGEGETRQRIPAKCLTSIDRAPLVVVAAPAEKLPPPIRADKDVELELKMPLVLSGYEADSTTRGPAAHSPFVATATLTATRLSKDGMRELSCPDAPDLSLAVVATEDGKVVGFTRASPYGGPHGGNYGFEPLDALQKLLEPRLIRVIFGFSAGDTKSITHEFVAVFDDPLGRVKSPVIRLQRDVPPPPDGLDEAEKTRYRWPGPRPKSGAWGAALPLEASALSLRRGKPAETVKRQFPSLRQHDDDKMFVAHFTMDHPGQIGRPRFCVQVSFTDERDQKTVYTRPETLEFNISRQEYLPDIPGLDGRPVDYPVAVKLVSGGYRLTSERTRIGPMEPIEFPLPIPKRTGKSVAGKSYRLGDANAVELNISRPNLAKHISLPTHLPNRPIVFSPDGAWLYIVDREHVIHKVSTKNFEEECVLETGAGCASLAYSKSGLVVSADDAEAVWVVDPATLEIKRIIHVQGVHQVAASPASTIGFAVGRHEGKEDVRAFSQLVMIDLEKGRPLHRIKDKYGRPGSYMVPAAGGTSLFSMGMGAPYVTADGRRLYVTGYPTDGKFYQFSFDDNAIVFERMIPKYPIALGDHLFAVRNRKKIDVYDIDNVENPKFVLNAPQVAVGFHPSTHRVYQATVGNERGRTLRELMSYDFRGNDLRSHKLPSAAAISLIPNTAISDVVIWCHSSLLYLKYPSE